MLEMREYVFVFRHIRYVRETELQDVLMSFRRGRYGGSGGKGALNEWGRRGLSSAEQSIAVYLCSKIATLAVVILGLVMKSCCEGTDVSAVVTRTSTIVVRCSVAVTSVQKGNALAQRSRTEVQAPFHTLSA